MTEIRRGGIKLNAKVNHTWLQIQEMNSVHFVNLVKAELTSRGEPIEMPTLSRQERTQAYEKQIQLIEQGMKKAKGY